MSGVRLYVGGLGGSVDEGVLKSHLATYGGTVVQIDIKEKKDAEGIVMTRFAYVNIEASNNQIQQCINSLNGSVWNGSRLKVERARESFMERLQRERAGNKQQQQKQEQQGTIARQVLAKDTQVKQSQKTFKPLEPSQSNQKQLQWNKRPLVNTELRDTGGSVKKKKVDDSSCDSSDSESSDDSSDEVRDGIPMFRGTANFHLDNEYEGREKSVCILNEKHKHIEKDHFKLTDKGKVRKQGDSGLFKESMVRSKDKVEEDLLSNFKNFSSVWGDSDDDYDDNYEEDSDDDSSESINKESKMEQDEKTENKDSSSISEDPGFFIDLQPAKVSSIQSGVVHNKSRSAAANNNIEDDGIGDVEAERQTQLDILSGILGKPMTVTEHKTDEKKERHMKRYDPTLPEHKQYEVSKDQQQQLTCQELNKTEISKHEIHSDSIKHQPLGQDKYIKVSQNLNFKEKSEGFSMLSMFSQKKTESSEETEEEEEEGAEYTETITSSQLTSESAQILKKKTKFFLHEHDAVIDEGIQWLSQSLTQEICDEFEKIRPDLVQVYKTRMVRAKRDAKDSRGRGRGRGRVRVRVPLKDHKQQSKSNQNKKIGKDGPNHQENSGVVKHGQFNAKRKFEGRGRGLGRGRGRGRGRGQIQGKG